MKKKYMAPKIVGSADVHPCWTPSRANREVQCLSIWLSSYDPAIKTILNSRWFLRPATYIMHRVNNSFYTISRCTSRFDGSGIYFCNEEVGNRDIVHLLYAIFKGERASILLQSTTTPTAAMATSIKTEDSKERYKASLSRIIRPYRSISSSFRS